MGREPRRLPRVLYPWQVDVMNRVALKGGDVGEMRHAIGYLTDKEGFLKSLNLSGLKLIRTLRPITMRRYGFGVVLNPSQVYSVASIIEDGSRPIEECAEEVISLLDMPEITTRSQLYAALKRSGYVIMYAIVQKENINA